MYKRQGELEINLVTKQKIYIQKYKREKKFINNLVISMTIKNYKIIR